MSFITIATEDELSEAVGCRLVSELLPDFEIVQKLRRGGNGYLKTKCQNFNQMAKRHPVLLITDLDNSTCPSALIQNWFGGSVVNENLKFRVAVKEIESWLLADHSGMTKLLGKGANSIVENPDQLHNPKEYLLQCAKRAPRDVKNDLIRSRGALATQGLGYNARLCAFAKDEWAPENASQRSNSLARAMQRLREMA
jgi:hypothetical protein